MLNSNGKTLFVDLLYQPKGSFDDDFATISQALEGNSIFHLKVRSKCNLGALLEVVGCIWKESPRNVVFLSAKLWQLIVLSPLALFFSIYAVYHFRPKTRGRLHDLVLPVLAKIYSFAAYSENVRAYLRKITTADVPLVASRLINKHQSFELLIKKLESDEVRVFCPGIRSGVRVPLAYVDLKRGIESALGRQVSALVVQDTSNTLPRAREVTAWLPSKLPDEEYACLYADALIVGMRFCPDYEPRSSAMINDALGNGCIVLTDEHPITVQYGYPEGLVTNLEHLPRVIESICNGTIGPGQIPGFDKEEARKSWIGFLNLDV